MNKVLFKFSLSLVLTCCLSMNAWPEIYQWTDDKGQTHFGDRAPRNSASKEMSKHVDRINITSDLSSPEMMLRHQQAKDAEREKKYKAWQEQHENQTSKAIQCKNLKKRLKKISGRVVFINDQGKDVNVSETERKQRVIQLDTEIRKHCQ